MDSKLLDVLSRMVTSAPRALVVDEHPMVADAMATAIAAVHIFERVDCAHSLAQGWKMLEENPVCNLAVVDLPLREAHGRAGLNGLRERFPDVPVLIFSGDEDLECITMAFECGARGFVTKSSPVSLLTNAIRLVITGGTWIPSEVADLLGPPPPQVTASKGAAPALELTGRQQQVLRLVLQGMPTRVIAARLSMAESTVDAHMNTIFRVLGVGTRVEVILRARQLGIA
jgi:DNA-binding NarL/FixJ family response regulator